MSPDSIETTCTITDISFSQSYKFHLSYNLTYSVSQKKFTPRKLLIIFKIINEQ